MRIVCLSDTHGRHGGLDVPDGDVLLHAGDFTSRGEPHEIEAFDAFLARLPHRHKVVVAGNHDFLFQDEPAAARALLTHAEYLEDGEASIEGLRVFGSPWQPWFGDWAFNLPRGPALAERWARVPERVDVLVTHGPPFGILDLVWNGKTVGCEDLTRELARIAPRLHVFGHIHESYGIVRRGDTVFVNASVCDRAYRPVQPPIVLDWSPDGIELVSSLRA